MLFAQHKILSGLFLALALQLGAHGAAWSKDVFPMHQGLHEWPVASGKIMAVVGTYQDSTTFRRSYNFYFKAKDQDQWNQVPVVRTSDDVDFSPESAGAGDNTIADGIVVAQGANVYFVFADKRPGKGATAVTWYKFVESDNAHPDDPGYYFKPVFTRSYAKNSKQTIDEVLAKESTLKPAK
jgi:hypothetical protein